MARRHPNQTALYGKPLKKAKQAHDLVVSPSAEKFRTTSGTHRDKDLAAFDAMCAARPKKPPGAKR